MKSKIILLIAGAAVVTLSFTFATSTHVEKKATSEIQNKYSDAPAGGLALEEK